MAPHNSRAETAGNPAPPPLFIRADAGLRHGYGHIMRCLSLGQAWQDSGGHVTFITSSDSPAVANRLRNEGFAVINVSSPYPAEQDLAITTSALLANPGSWLVLDGYHFDPAFQREIRTSANPLLVIDDMAQLHHYHADIILNQNINAGDLHYSHEPQTRLLRGLDYVFLRREFTPWQTWTRDFPRTGSKVLVSMGGGDPDNNTFKILTALKQMQLPALEAKIVLGAINPHLPTLQSVIRGFPGAVELIQEADNMPLLMAWADIAISGGGSTSWELLFMGLPSLLMITSDNQKGITEKLDKMGVTINLGQHTDCTPSAIAGKVQSVLKNHDLRTRMSRKGRELVNGMGAQKIITIMQGEKWFT